MLTCIFGQRAPYSILSSMYKKTTNAGNTQEKKSRVIIIFSALIIISVNHLHNIIMTWTISFKSQQFKVKQTYSSFTFQVTSSGFIYTVQTCMSHLNTP